MTETSASSISLRGTLTALITPFTDSGEIDWDKLIELVDRQLDAGVDWLVACGTTGETPTLSTDEREKVLETILHRSNGRCYVLAGTGSNNTAQTVTTTKKARAAGAHAAMVVAPYYNRPTPEGLYRHYAAVADAVDLPIVIYNVPARTAVHVPNDVVVRLRQDYEHIVAVKHATGTVDGVTDLRSRCDIEILSGDDSITYPLLTLGACGVVSVLSNLWPDRLLSLVNAVRDGKHSEALRAHQKISALADGLSAFGPNPLPIKTAMALKGLIVPRFRLPLCPLPEDATDSIRAMLERMELLRACS